MKRRRLFFTGVSSGSWHRKSQRDNVKTSATHTRVVGTPTPATVGGPLTPRARGDRLPRHKVPNVLLALPTVAISLNVAAGSAPKTVWNGVYTKEQAVRGEQHTCEPARTAIATTSREMKDRPSSDCGSRFSGRPHLEGFCSTRSQARCPTDAPGSLALDQYADVIGFLLEKNGAPAGVAPCPWISFGHPRTIVLTRSLGADAYGAQLAQQTCRFRRRNEDADVEDTVGNLKRRPSTIVLGGHELALDPVFHQKLTILFAPRTRREQYRQLFGGKRDQARVRDRQGQSWMDAASDCDGVFHISVFIAHPETASLLRQLTP